MSRSFGLSCLPIFVILCRLRYTVKHRKQTHGLILFKGAFWWAYIQAGEGGELIIGVQKHTDKYRLLTCFCCLSMLISLFLGDRKCTLDFHRLIFMEGGTYF